MTKEKTKPLICQVPMDLHKELKLLAIKMDMTMTDVVIKSLSNTLNDPVIALGINPLADDTEEPEAIEEPANTIQSNPIKDFAFDDDDDSNDE